MALCWGRPRAPHGGCLRDSLLVAFEGLRTTVPSVATVLSGPVQDQAALAGRLDRSSRWAWSGWVRQLPAAADEVPTTPEHHPPDP